MVHASQCVAVGIALSLLVACGPQPCATCLGVGGQYSESIRMSSATCDDGSFLEFGGGSDSVIVSESGSTLTLEGFSPMPGVLHSDNSASFSPVDSAAFPIDGAGNPDPSGIPEAGKWYLEGWFTAGSFEGTYVFIEDANGCEIDSPTQWARM